MKYSTFLLSGLLCTTLFSCSSNPIDEIVNPEMPNPEDDSGIVEAKIGYSFESYETPLSRSGGNDLIGLDIAVLQNNEPQTYAWGVFDDVSLLKAKFVKGYKYRISLNYFPDAKSIVYNYPNGTFGSPFSYIYDAHDYNLNEVNYFSGNYNDGPTGDQAAYLVNMFGNLVQNSSAEYNRDFILGTSQRFLGQTDFLEISEQTINVELENYMMALRLEIGNFKSGNIRLLFNGSIYIFNPGDEMEIMFQIPYFRGLRNNDFVGGQASKNGVKVFYDATNSESWLLATSDFEYKKNTRITYKFNLEEREDGSIGIMIKDNESMNEEEGDFFD